MAATLLQFILKGQTVHDHPWYMALDLIATCGLFIEVLLRYVAKPTVPGSSRSLLALLL